MDIKQFSPDPAFILKLPDELLEKIVSAVTPVLREYGWRTYEHYEKYEMAVGLSLVSKRFNRITVPYLYSDLSLSTSNNTLSRPKHVHKLLHRSFRQNPSLWSLCRHIKVDYDKSNTDNLSVITDFMTWCTAAKTLTFHNLEGKKAWELLQLAIEHLPGCTDLSLHSNHPYELHLPFVIDVLGNFKSGVLPNLRKLRLSGVSFHGDQMCQIELREMPGTAPFTTLQLRTFLLTPKTLEALVRWPRRLEEFELKFTFGDDFSTPGICGDWSLATLQPILYVHRKSLRSIKLYGFNKGGFGGFDLREFENLEELSLSSEFSGHQRLHKDNISDPPDGLFAPRLRVFRWDLTLLDQQRGEGLHHFGQAEEAWLRLFARKALEHGCPLQKIEIKFRPENDRCWESRHEVYPWDRMDAIGTDLKQHGTEVSYDPPTVSREEFLEELSDPREDPVIIAEIQRVINNMRNRINRTIEPTV